MLSDLAHLVGLGDVSILSLAEVADDYMESSGYKEVIARIEGHGAFSRVFTFGPDVNRDAIAADLNDGLLTITLPKHAGATARRCGSMQPASPRTPT